MKEKKGKIDRILGIYSKLVRGELVKKDEEALFYNVNERSIQRDIDDIRNFFVSDAENTGVLNTIIYDWQKKGYRLEKVPGKKT